MNREQLETERNVLMNSFGRGQFHDGRLRERIEEIDRRLSRLQTTR